MSEEDLKKHVEDADDIEGFTNALEKFREKFEQLEKRVENLEEKNKTKVRVVDTENGKRIVLEDRQQTWFSPNYFRTILDSIDEGSSGSSD